MANLPDILSALLPKQIQAADEELVRRREVALRYETALQGRRLRLLGKVEGAISAEHLFVIGVGNEKRHIAIRLLNSAGISVTVNYRSLLQLKYYRRHYPAYLDACPVANRWGSETISLPLYPELPLAEQDYVIRCVVDLIEPLLAE